jgi:diguanylate cyclase (GGDEF)-like protein
VATLSSEQSRRLLDARRHLTASVPEETVRQLVAHVGGTLGTKAALVGRRGRTWTVFAESAPDPVLAIPRDPPPVFDRVGAAPGHQVDAWRQGGLEWTLVGLAERPDAPVMLLLAGDWTPSTPVLRELARKLLGGNGDILPPSSVDVAARRLTRALADTTGLRAVCDLALGHVVDAVPSRLASLAVAAPDGALAILATRGYPRALVEHLRIRPGSGVIGAVSQSRAPMLVADASALRTPDRRRTRYQSNSFIAAPILAGTEVLGVVSLTDRIGGDPYTRSDAAAVSVLTAPVALVLGRERSSREARAYAQAAVIDPVSGLFNRRYFQARLEEELQRAGRQRTPVGLLMIDVDGFKAINDRFGHPAGDAVIRDVSEIMRRSVRMFDVCTRFGGEEFAVMMPGGTADGTRAIAERIRQRVEAYQRSEPELSGLRVTVSVGVAVAPPGATARDLVERADRALYHAKDTGKNRVSVAKDDGTAENA